jgi:hypothetical protein
VVVVALEDGQVEEVTIEGLVAVVLATEGEELVEVAEDILDTCGLYFLVCAPSIQERICLILPALPLLALVHIRFSATSLLPRRYTT